jgi:hypothetical protein
MFKAEKRSTRYLHLVFSFQRILSLYSACSKMAAFYTKNSSSTDNPNTGSGRPEPKNIEEADIKGMLPEKLKDDTDNCIAISNEYFTLFAPNNLKREIFRRIDDEKDIPPNQDKFNKVIPLFIQLMKFAGKELTDYQFIYTIKKTKNKYLIIRFATGIPKPEYIFLEQELSLRTVYLNKKGTYDFINMHPFIFYRQCKYHLEKELFIFSNTQYRNLTGEKRLHHIGEQFMCSPTSPLKEDVEYEQP